MKTRLLIIFAISIVVSLGAIDSVYAYQIHDLTYSNSPYQNKQTPSLGKTTEYLYQAYGENTKNRFFDLTVSITNLDEQKQVYFKNHQLSAKGIEKPHDIFWNYIPEKSGLYVVEVLDESEKYKRYFAIPKDDSLKRAGRKASCNY